MTFDEIILNIVGGIVLMVAGILIFIGCEPVENLIKRRRLITTGKRINATVVGLKETYIRTRFLKYHPVLEYTIDNVTHKVTYKFEIGNTKGYKLSQIVEIACNNDNPKDIVIVREMGTVAASSIFVFLGLLSTVAGFLVIIYAVLR